MKIVIISPFQKSLPRGIERFCYSLANALGALGHTIIIYTWASKKNFSWGALHANVHIKECPNFRYYQREWIGYYYNFLLNKDKPDAVILNFLYHGEIKLSNKWNYTYVLHSPASQIKTRYEYIKEHITKFTKLKFVAVSNMVKREGLPYMENRECAVIFNGVDLELFKPSDAFTKHKKFKIITVAALEQRKGIQFMINAIAAYPEKNNIEYHIYGDGSYKKELVALIEKMNLENVVTINKPVGNLYDVLKGFDLFTLLSKGEAFPIAPLEAMASGLPLLVSSYEPYPEFIQPEFGYMIHPKEEKRIHVIVGNLSKDNKLKEAMALSSRKNALRYSWAEVAKEYVKYI